MENMVIVHGKVFVPNNETFYDIEEYLNILDRNQVK